MPNSKDEARSEAFRRLRDVAVTAEKEARAGAEAAEARAKLAEDKVLTLTRDLEAAREKIIDGERCARTQSIQAVGRASELEGAKADLLATTRRAIVGEVLLKDADVRISSLTDALRRIATWPLAHSAEARAMREVAAQGLASDQARRCSRTQLEGTV